MCSMGRGASIASPRTTRACKLVISNQAAARQNVLLKAIAAAPTRDHLPLQRVEVELRRPVQQHINAFVGNRCGMSLDHSPQRLKHRYARSLIPDTA